VGTGILSARSCSSISSTLDSRNSGWRNSPRQALSSANDPHWIFCAPSQVRRRLSGRLVADVPAVFVGDKLAAKMTMKFVHSIAAGIFAVPGVATPAGAGKGFGL